MFWSRAMRPTLRKYCASFLGEALMDDNRPPPTPIYFPRPVQQEGDARHDPSQRETPPQLPGYNGFRWGLLGSMPEPPTQPSIQKRNFALIKNWFPISELDTVQVPAIERQTEISDLPTNVLPAIKPLFPQA